MEDDKLKKLFAGFDPEMASDACFMSGLRKSMEAVEIVRQHSMAMRRKNRKAVVIAAVAGFVSGVLFTLLLPMIGEWLHTSRPTAMASLALHYRMVAWIAVAGASALIAKNTYDVSMSVMGAGEHS